MAAALIALLVLAATVARVAAPESGGEGPKRGAKAEYAFLAETDRGDPVRWNPCVAIHYVVNAELAPAGALDDVHEAIRVVSEATGVEFVYDGETDEIPQEARRAADPERYETGWDPLVIAWVRPEQTDISFRGHDDEEVAIGLAAPQPSTVETDDVYVSGFVLLDVTQDLPTGFSPFGWGPVILHELGHAIGLGHVASYTELMNGSGIVRTDFGEGDLRGLAELGRSAGCVETPPPPDLCYAWPSSYAGTGALVAAAQAGRRGLAVIGEAQVLEWKGRRWETAVLERITGVPTGLIRLRDVAAPPGAGALLAGYEDRDPGGPRSERPLLFRAWRGSWLPVLLPPAAGRADGRLEAIAADGARDVWVVGGFAPRRNGPHEALMLHFDGRTWSSFDAPRLPREAWAWDVAAVTPDDAWAIARAGDDSFVLRWDGERWRRAWTVRGSTLTAVAATRSDVWAVGSDDQGGVVLHAGRYAAFETVWPVGDAQAYYDVEIDASGTVWLAGERAARGGPDSALLAAFDGDAWTMLRGESRFPGEPAVFYAVAPLPSGGALGLGASGNPERPLLEAPC